MDRIIPVVEQSSLRDKEMINIKLKIKNYIKKGPAPHAPTLRRGRSGFVILFAVTLSSILLAIALGVSNIALKEINFSTSAKNTNDAFVSADVGAECALYNDKSIINKFPLPFSATPISSCAGLTPTPTGSGTATTASYDFVVTGLGSLAQGCASRSQE